MAQVVIINYNFNFLERKIGRITQDEKYKKILHHLKKKKLIQKLNKGDLIENISEYQSFYPKLYIFYNKKEIKLLELDEGTFIIPSELNLLLDFPIDHYIRANFLLNWFFDFSYSITLQNYKVKRISKNKFFIRRKLNFLNDKLKLSLDLIETIYDKIDGFYIKLNEKNIKEYSTINITLTDPNIHLSDKEIALLRRKEMCQFTGFENIYSRKEFNKIRQPLEIIKGFKHLRHLSLL